MVKGRDLREATVIPGALACNTTHVEMITTLGVTPARMIQARRILQASSTSGGFQHGDWDGRASLN